MRRTKVTPRGWEHRAAMGKPWQECVQLDAYSTAPFSSFSPSSLFSGEAKAETEGMCPFASFSDDTKTVGDCTSFIAIRRLLICCSWIKARSIHDPSDETTRQRITAHARSVMKQVPSSLRARIGRCPASVACRLVPLGCLSKHVVSGGSLNLWRHSF